MLRNTLAQVVGAEAREEEEAILEVITCRIAR
jgi:hypothetical protein